MKQTKPKLSKEQIAQQMKMVEEATRFKKLIKDAVYPALQKADSLAHAQQMCEVLKTVMMSKVNAYWADKRVSDLGLMEDLTNDKDAKDVDAYRELIEALNGLSITDAQRLMQGMAGVLDGYTNKLAADKKMEDIPVKEIIND